MWLLCIGNFCSVHRNWNYGISSLLRWAWSSLALFCYLLKYRYQHMFMREIKAEGEWLFWNRAGLWEIPSSQLALQKALSSLQSHLVGFGYPWRTGWFIRVFLWELLGMTFPLLHAPRDYTGSIVFPDGWSWGEGTGCLVDLRQFLQHWWAMTLVNIKNSGFWPS